MTVLLLLHDTLRSPPLSLVAVAALASLFACFSSLLAMGNQVSSSIPPPPPPHPSSVARLLLSDGSVLHFTQPIKAIRLLLQYPNHSICPSLSLLLVDQLGAPVSLLPDEQLQLGQLYVLLPLQTLVPSNFAAAASDGNLVSLSMLGLEREAKSVSTRRLHASAGEEGFQTSENRPLLQKSKSQSAPLCGLLQNDRLCNAPELQKAWKKTMRRCRSWKPGLQDITDRVSNTPEVQKTNRKLTVRRCRSWRPRLQDISEVQVATAT